MGNCKNLSVRDSKLTSDLSRKVSRDNAEWLVGNGFNESIFDSDMFNKIKSDYNEDFAYKAIVNNIRYYNSLDVLEITDNLKRSISLKSQSIDGKYSVAGLKTIMGKLSERTGIGSETFNDKESDEKGYFDPTNSVVHINVEKYTKDTVFHEFIHPMITVIKNNNKVFYGKLMHELKSADRGKELIEQIKNSYDYLSETEIWEEALVTFIGEESSKYVKKDGTHTKSFVSILQKLWDYISDTLNNLIFDPDKKITVEDLLAMNDIKELAILMNLENEFDDTLKDEISYNFIFKNDSLTVKGEELPTNGIQFQKETLDEEKKKKDLLIAEHDRFTKGGHKLSGLSYSALKNKGSEELGIGPIAPNMDDDEKKDMYEHRAARRFLMANKMSDLTEKEKEIKVKEMYNDIDDDGVSAYDHEINAIINIYHTTTDILKIMKQYIYEAEKSDELRKVIGNKVDNHTKDFFITYNKLKEKFPSKSYDTISDMAKNELLGKLTELKNDHVNNKLDEETVLFLDGLVEFINEQERLYGNRGIKFFADFHVSSVIKEQEVQAKIDLIGLTDDGESIIIDFKSRKAGILKQWDYNFGKFFENELSGIEQTKRNDVAMQTSFYEMVIKSKGIKVMSTSAIYVEVDSVINDNGEYKNGENFRIRKGQGSIDIRLTSYLGKLENLLFNESLSFGGKNFGFVSGRDNSHIDLMTKLLGGNDMNNGELSARYFATRPYHNTDGRLGFLDKNNEFVEFTSNNIEERIKQVTPHVLERIKQNKLLAENSISYFYGNTNSFPNNTDKLKSVQTMFNGLSPEDYDLKMINQISGFEKVKSPIIVAINKQTKVKMLLYFSNDSHNIPMKFEDKKRTNIFGEFITDTTAKRIINDDKFIRGDSMQYRKLEISLIAAEMKRMDNSTEIDRIRISSDMHNKNKPYVMDMHDGVSILNNVKKLISIVPDKFDLAGHNKEIFSRDHYFNPKSYNPNFVYNLVDSIINYKELTSKDSFKRLSNNVYAYRDGEITKRELMRELISFQNTLKGKFKDGKDYTKQPEYIAVANAIKYLAGMENRVTGKHTLSKITEYATIEQNFPDYTRQRMATIVKSNDHRIRVEFKEFKSKHEKLLKAMADSRNISFSSKVITPSMLKLYDNLYKNKDMDYQNPSTLMVMKDENDSSLNTEEKAYIKFVNERMEFALRLTGLREESYKKGFLPVYKATKQTRRAKDNRNGKILGRSIGFEDQDIKSIEEETTMDDIDPITDISIDSFFSIDVGLTSKYSNPEGQVGIDVETGEMREGFNPDRDIETNIEFILDKAMVEAFNYDAHMSSMAIAEAVNVSMYYNVDDYGGKDAVDYTINGIKSFIAQSVKGEVIKAGKYESLNKAIVKINMAATNLAIVSSRQIVMDSMTYLLGSTSMAVTNFLYKSFGGDTNTPGYFDTKSWIQAGKMLVSDSKLAQEIMKEYAIDTTDAKRLMSRNNKLSMRSDFTETVFSPSRGAMLAVHTQAFLANIIQDESINAYSLDETGSLQYDEKKDLRYYTANGIIKDEAFLIAIKNQMLDDDTFGIEDLKKDDEGKLIQKNILNRKLKRGYTSIEINNIRNRSAAMMGVFDKDGINQLNRNVMFRAMFKFMTWMMPRIDQYWMEKSESEILKEWKKRVDEFGKEGYVAEAMVHEGIIQTLMGTSKLVYGMALGEITGDAAKLENYEKRNLAIFASHAIAFLAVYGMLKAFQLSCKDSKGESKECFLKHTAMGMSTERILLNVQSDMFILSNFVNWLDGSQSFFAGFGVVYSAVTRTISSMFHLFNMSDDETIGGTFHDNSKRSLAAYRSFYEIYDLGAWLNESQPREKQYK